MVSKIADHIQFQSTPSVWRETGIILEGLLEAIFQSTPSVWRETIADDLIHVSLRISIHSLRVEGDGWWSHWCRRTQKFQSTPSVWRETQFPSIAFVHVYISIHSLRVEGDWRNAKAAIAKAAISIHSLRVEGDTYKKAYITAIGNFNPLPPCGGRQ